MRRCAGPAMLRGSGNVKVRVRRIELRGKGKLPAMGHQTMFFQIYSGTILLPRVENRCSFLFHTRKVKSFIHGTFAGPLLNLKEPGVLAKFSRGLRFPGNGKKIRSGAFVDCLSRSCRTVGKSWVEKLALTGGRLVSQARHFTPISMAWEAKLETAGRQILQKKKSTGATERGRQHSTEPARHLWRGSGG